MYYCYSLAKLGWRGSRPPSWRRYEGGEKRVFTALRARIATGANLVQGARCETRSRARSFSADSLDYTRQKSPRIIGVCIFDVKKRPQVELLPAERNVRIEQRRTSLSERLVTSHDAVIVVLDRHQPPARLSALPFGARLMQLHRQARGRGPVHLLSDRVSPSLTMIVVALIDPSASTFELLSAAAKAWKEAAAAAPRKVLIAAPGLDAVHAPRVVEAMTAAVLAGSALLPQAKSRPAPPVAVERITLLGEGPFDTRRWLAEDRGNHLARWLTMLPPNVLNSRGYRRALAMLARRKRWGLRVFDRKALRRLGAGAFLAVARANSNDDAAIVRLRYRAPRRSSRTRHLTLVGKGLCFDTGGINLKPHKAMLHMHEDMQGSAVAVGALLALSELKVPFDIDCWLAITENEIGANAYRPQEIVRAANGTTIQVIHSDAEGRMVLADTLALACRDRPDVIIDYATLTGACIMALTERYSGVFTNRSELHGLLQRAGADSGERVWPFPMDGDFDTELESNVADVMQCTLDSKGDHILAARFLNRFVPENIPWIHIDLASSNRTGGLAHIPSDFTGFGVRYTTQLLLDRDLMSTQATGPLATGKLGQ